MAEVIPEPRFVLATFISLPDLAERYCAEERPSEEHLKAEMHLNEYNVPQEMAWHLVIGWHAHEPVQVTPVSQRSMSPVTAGSDLSENPNVAIFLQLPSEERFIDGNNGLILEDFQALLATAARYVLEYRYPPNR